MNSTNTQTSASTNTEQEKPKSPIIYVGTTTGIPKGMQIKERLGEVSGLSVKTRNLIRDIGSEIKGILGGEMKANAELLSQTKEAALERLKESAAAMGANAIIGVRYESVPFADGVGFVAYGTAVILEKKSLPKSTDLKLDTAGLPKNPASANESEFKKQA